MRTFALIAFAFLLPSFALANDKPFAAWLEGVRGEAITQGIRKETVDKALADVSPSEQVLELDQKQPEKKLELGEYLDKVISQARITKGRELRVQYRRSLDHVSEQYQVSPSVILALWGIETSYGDNTGGFDIIEALATLAYDGRRSDFFRNELMKALWVLDAEHISRDDFQGSWAGAMGQCQFMPTSFLKYAVDFDGDGKRDIWNTEVDVFASIANYLHSEGWDMNGKIIEGSNNFKVLLKWNRSRYFATAVGRLAEAIGE